MSKLVPLYVKIDDRIKERLDLYAFKNGLRLNVATEKILDENLPHYELTESE